MIEVEIQDGEMVVSNTDTPVCPHCKHEHHDWCDFVRGDRGIMTCDECGKEFAWEAETVTVFTTNAPDEREQ